MIKSQYFFCCKIDDVKEVEKLSDFFKVSVSIKSNSFLIRRQSLRIKYLTNT